MKYQITALSPEGTKVSSEADGVGALRDKLATLRLFGCIITDVSSKRNVLRLRKIKYSL